MTGQIRDRHSSYDDVSATWMFPGLDTTKLTRTSIS
jgi:hypothetical protein